MFGNQYDPYLCHYAENLIGVLGLARGNNALISRYLSTLFPRQQDVSPYGSENTYSDVTLEQGSEHFSQVPPVWSLIIPRGLLDTRCRWR